MNGISLNIDPGSSVTTAVCRLPGGATFPLTIDGHPFLSSAVVVTSDGTVHVGGRLPSEGRRVQSPLLALAADSSAAGTTGGEAGGTVDVAAAVLRRLAAEATTVTGLPVTELRIVVPSGWGPRRRNLVRRAAAVAGLPVPDLPPLPTAIAVGAGHTLGLTVPVGGFLLVCDIGASGTTASVVRRRTDVEADVVSTISAADAGTDALDNALTLHLAAGATIAPADMAPDRLSAIAAARRSLSDMEQATVATDTAWMVTRDLLAALSVPVVARSAQTAAAAVEAADLDAADLAGIVIVGGGAHLPGVAAAVSLAVGAEAVVAPRPEQAVVLAAAHKNPSGNSGRWAVTRPSGGLLRSLAPTVAAGMASLVLLNHAMVSAVEHTEAAGWIDYVLFNSGEFATACALVLVAALSAARMLALIDLDRAQASPARVPRPGRVFLSAAGAGLLIVVIYALLTGVYLHQAAGEYLSLGFEAAAPLAAIAVVVAGLTPRLRYLGGTAFDRLRYPLTSMMLAAAGIAAIQYAENSRIPLTAIDIISRIGGALAGAGCAWLLVRASVGRWVAVPLLAAVGALSASVETNYSYGGVYIACLWFWFARSALALVADAFPDLREWAQRWRPRFALPEPEVADPAASPDVE